MRPDSDLDILIVRPDHVALDDAAWLEQVVRLEAAFSAWTGNDVQVLEWSATDVRRGLETGEPVLRDILRDGIRLHGPSAYLRRLAA